MSLLIDASLLMHLDCDIHRSKCVQCWERNNDTCVHQRDVRFLYVMYLCAAPGTATHIGVQVDSEPKLAREHGPLENVIGGCYYSYKLVTLI